VRLFADIYRGRRVLITGHTGFKGSWLSLWLKELGADINGISLDPNPDANHWDLLKLDAVDHRQDIRDLTKILALIRTARPEVVFHLAAQPLVRHSYREPIETWSTNVMGTAHVLEACRHVDSVKAIVAVTTDKVYTNQEWHWGYRENDRLGGHDPYSASKAACELLIESYRKAFFSTPHAPLVASARAGNVVGGGDWSEDRLVPDLVRSISQREPLVIRSPHATRPWQHVLECLAGYLLLGQKLLEGRREYADAWNFGSAQTDTCTVAEVLTRLQSYWPELAWEITQDPQPHEARLLCLDDARARAILAWQPVWKLDQALQATAEWYRGFLEAGVVASRAQLADYVDAAQSSGASWVLA
jgi:CDP-glucose 4,6-dehydratase